jgi:hypothetical protein
MPGRIHNDMHSRRGVVHLCIQRIYLWQSVNSFVNEFGKLLKHYSIWRVTGLEPEGFPCCVEVKLHLLVAHSEIAGNRQLHQKLNNEHILNVQQLNESFED